MKVFEAIKRRRSVRKFNADKKLTDQQIERLLEAARWAPSAGNLQCQYLVVVEEQEVKEQLAEAALNQQYISEAPIAIVGCADVERSALKYGERGANLYSIQEATIAMQNIFLAATEMGLGACWVGAFYEDRLIEILDLPENFRPIVIMPIGYPAESPEAPDRKSINEISKRI